MKILLSSEVFRQVNKFAKMINLVPVQSTITYSKLTMETLEKRCEMYSKLTINTPERRQRRSGVFIVNFEYISHLVSHFLLLTLSR